MLGVDLVRILDFDWTVWRARARPLSLIGCSCNEPKTEARGRGRGLPFRAQPRRRRGTVAPGGREQRVHRPRCSLSSATPTAGVLVRFAKRSKAGTLPRPTRPLGRPFSLRGTVVHGDARGRGLGYPTPNLSLDSVPDPARPRHLRGSRSNAGRPVVVRRRGGGYAAPVYDEGARPVVAARSPLQRRSVQTGGGCRLLDPPARRVDVKPR